MKQVVYVDVLVVLNIFVNYFLLLETAFISREKASRIRILLASILGGIYSLIIILPPLPTYLSILVKLFFSVTLVLASFKIKTIKHFIRMFLMFFFVNFAFAGLMFAIWMILKPNGMVYNNGAVYFNINALLLTILTIVCYVIIALISKLTQKNAPSNKVYTITVQLEDKTITGTALVDTGNSLCDTFSDTPVIVAEYRFIKDILPDELKEFFNKSEIYKLDNIPEPWENRIRLIPYNSVGSEGLLKSFKPDKIIISDRSKNTQTDNVYIAVNNSALSNGEYSVLLNTRLLQDFEVGAIK